MKREPRVLLTKATDSMLLAIEHFNRPWDRGRPEAVLLLLDRAIELLLKAVIIHKGGRIREPRAKETIGFKACVRKCTSDVQVRCLDEGEALTLQIINSLRDAAQHYAVDVSEQQLYIYAQAGVTLSDKVLRTVFGRKLSDCLPDRVLPVSSNPPRDFESVMDVEFQDIQKLLLPGSRRAFQVRGKLRSFAIVEACLSGDESQPSESHLRKLTKRVSKGESWQDLFPGISGLRLTTEGNGLNVNLRITKSQGEPVHLVPEGTPEAPMIAVRRVDELGYYSLNLTALSSKVNLTVPKTLAVVKCLKLQADSEYFKEFHIGKSRFKMYSPKALDRLKKELPNLDVNEIWNEYKPYGRKEGGVA